MSQIYAGVGSFRATFVRLTVGNKGPWQADVDFDDVADVSGAVVLTIGALKLSGTVVDSGVFGGSTRVRIVAGAGGWGAEVAAKGYHNDAGVKARIVADDAARAVGESLGSFLPTAERIGADYVRQAGPASTALEDALGGALWWVDYQGVTQCTPRPKTTPAPSAYQVLAYDPRDSVVTLAADDPSTIVVGSVLSGGGLDGSLTVRDLELTVDKGELRIAALCGGEAAGDARLAGLLRSIIARATDGKLFGAYRYRVLKMSADRVDLQAVRKDAGLPDVANVSMWPGVAGSHATLTPGAEVLVQFIEGDRTMPIVTHFAGKDGTGFAPVLVTLGGDGSADFVALSAKVDTEIQRIWGLLSGAGTPPLWAPVSMDGGLALQAAAALIANAPVPVIQSTAAEKVKAV
jgi:hypothetical protein